MHTSAGLAIVTGASSGLGAEFARQLAARQQPVLAVARRIGRLEELAAAARAAGHAPIHPLTLDVTRPEAASEIRDRARALGGASLLVNNAGTTRLGPFAASDAVEQAGMVRLNCESLVAITAAVVPDLVARGSGRILNVASIAGFQPTPMQTVYGATKAFVLSFSEGLSEELRGTGVTVTALCPGPVTTELFDVAAPGVARDPQGREMSAQDCVRFALSQADRGAVVAVPGAFFKFSAVASRLAPRAAVRRLSARFGIKFMGYEPKLFMRS